MAQLTGGPVMGRGARAGNFDPVPAKHCPTCPAVGEWPGRHCPSCVMGGPAPEPSTPARSNGSNVRSLDDLAHAINAAHERVRHTGREVVEHAIHCGQALLEAKQLVPRGEWLVWVNEAVNLDVTTAYRYMRLAEHADLVRASAADSIVGAMRELADLPRRGHGPRGYSAADKRAWAEMVKQFGVKPTARALGISPSTIWTHTRGDNGNRGPAARPKLQDALDGCDAAIEALALWLVERFGGGEIPSGDGVTDYPVRVTVDVRTDALAAISAMLEALRAQGETA